jgi:hypothetical protein
MSCYKFKDHVFKDPYRPYYDKYRGHIFSIAHYHPEDGSNGHVWLTCVDDSSIKVEGYIHIWDIEEIT